MRWVLCFKRLDFATENAFLGLFWGTFTGFYKIQNLMSLNISVLQLNLFVFANLHLRNCFRPAIEASFIALTYSQLCVFAFFAKNGGAD